MVPKVVERVLPLSHRVWNRQEVKWELGIGTDGKEVEMGTTKCLTNPLEDPWKQGPFQGEEPGRDD